ncbi:hypothetical protein PUMCH_002082 [Australozyma saopauloensis]|uniref:FXNA-related family protease 1 n=1 Tax=Australozyma saopauloensis TaxID=291208 RepID=A0AAX4H876_9ASCO|nr:hypothetical protein PUMCH_002082 [[Candida] saopauloensis]
MTYETKRHEVHRRKPGRFWYYSAITGFVLTFLLLCYLDEAKPILDPVEHILNLLEQNYAEQWSKKYTAETHLAGTNYGLVEWTRDKFEEYGWKTTIDTYDVYMSHPESNSLNLLDSDGQVVYSASLKEDEISEDPSTRGNDTVPTFLSYAANGNVTAQYVYANYGRMEDFALLKKLGVDVNDKIVIVRYGKIFRGLNVKFAQDEGAVGVLIYSDPGDDLGLTPANGYKQYPHGPARQDSSIQRGSVQFLGGVGAAPGDPTTPGYASKGDVPRVDPHASIGKIPVLPISYREVTPILEKLNDKGPMGPRDWMGELVGFNYNIGPSDGNLLNMYSNQTFNITPIWNVYAEIEGKRKDEVIIIGNHRDAWIKGGAGDPNSGSAALIEVARALGDLKKAGYQFKRTIILQSFDGEEYGLLGSTEFGEYQAQDLKRKVIAYFNMDAAVEGRHLRLGASPILNRLLRKVASWVPYPDGRGLSLYDHFLEESGDRISNLGSGSDYTVFLEHLGIPSADIGFRPGRGDGIYHYHSNYDSFWWMSNFGDKGFVFHNAAAKYLSLLALELSRKKLLDFSVEDYTCALVSYFSQIEAKIPHEWLQLPISHHTARKLRKSKDKNDRFVLDASQSVFGSYQFRKESLDHRSKHHKHQVQHKHRHTPTLGKILDKTRHSLQELSSRAALFDDETTLLQEQYDKRKQLHVFDRIWLLIKIANRNLVLKYFERNFLYHRGLHKRPWFKHIVFASGRYTGYAGQTWPGIGEAVEDGDIKRTVKWLDIAKHAAKRAHFALDYYG